ncbi:4Fe-4S cluster-binding domain-containing protein [bacterium]|nr:4Fe-4S cluster-binding domain-containing protein [bacterium]MBU1983048.1 4Fe-4S cluster-binding domain-containing protein [bacterium]
MNSPQCRKGNEKNHSEPSAEDPALLERDLFLVPHEGLFVLYRPISRLCALVDSNVVTDIRDLLAGEKAKDSSPALKRLDREGFFHLPVEAEFTATEEAAVDPEAPFRPHEVTLDITGECNLRCLYCYGYGGEKPQQMSDLCARAAVDLCIGNCEEDRRGFELNFHGSGEPTQHFQLMTELVGYARQKTSEKNLRLVTSVATNGVMSEDKARWIASYIDAISLSMDGDAEAQNRQRPTVRGGDSFAAVRRTADFWNRQGKRFNLRLTITRLNVERLQDICVNLAREFPQASINVEPMTICGRAHQSPELAPPPDIFAERLVETYRALSGSGSRVYYSGMRGFSRSHRFCSASTPAFSVMSDGSVTACFSYSSHEPIRNLFVYGSWNACDGCFVFDRERIAALRGLTMSNDPYCQTCFAKYHCIGDCPSIREYRLLDDKRFEEVFDVDFLKNRRCQINRTVLKLLLLQFL